MRLKHFITILLSLTLLAGCREKGDKMGSGDRANSPDTLRYEYSSFEEGSKLFNDLNYTPEAWQQGVREIPNLILVEIPDRWRETTAQEIEVKLKKQIFFRIIAPLALSVSAEIEYQRQELKGIMEKGLAALSDQEMQRLKKMAVTYKVIDTDAELSEEDLEELWTRVDVVPLSLVLAQSAEESGWGTSRFAAEGNALFGQWAWGANAIKPKEQRAGKGDYGIARFDSPLESMRAYMMNLNTHPAYAELRKARASLRKEGKKPDGATLAKTLTRYSERGEEYVRTLLSMMNSNGLAAADEAYLKVDPVILFIPVN